MHMAIDQQTTIQRERRLAWDACLNARDLGGYRTYDGRETRWGAIARSDNPAQLTEAGQAAVVDYGIRSMVDLRRPDEVQQHPNPFANPDSHEIAYTNISLVDPGAPSEDFTTLANDYKRMLDRFPDTIAEIMRTIAHAPEGGVLIHCMGGKDRTGVIAALLLDLVGVPRETIGEDYALTAECLRPRDEEWLENGPGERAERGRLLAQFMPRAEVMLEVLAHLDTRYGGVEGYLRHIGVSPDDVQRLRDRLIG